MPALRVVLDTNVLLSGLAYPASVPGKIMAAWRHGSVEVLLSAYILEELRRVLPAWRTAMACRRRRSTIWWIFFPYKPKSSSRCPAQNRICVTLTTNL